MSLKPRILSQQSGSVILNALAALVVIGLATGFMFDRANTLNQSLRLPRIKSAQSNIEMALRNLLLQPGAYANCNNPAGSGYASCVLDPALVNRLFEPIVGCVPAGANCGVRVGAGWAFTPATRTFTGQISYDGTELNIAPRILNPPIVVPEEVLQSPTIRCTDPLRPLLAGFNANGTPNCVPVGATTTCGPGEYIMGFNPSNMSVICATIQAATALSCPSGQFITSVNVANPSAITRNCGNIPFPSAVWGMPPF